MANLRARAPLRISFAGGGTDILPYAEERGGAVLNATITKFAYTSLFKEDGAGVTHTSHDLNTTSEFNIESDIVESSNSLGLVEAAVRRFPPGNGIRVVTRADAPPGCGLGSSSALVVSMVSLLKTWREEPITPYELADLSYEIERHDCGIAGGMQDQYASVFGGISFTEFHGREVFVNQLRIPPDTLAELEYRLILCFAGEARATGDIIFDQIQNYMKRKQNSVSALDELKDVATEMKAALLRGRTDELGDLMHQGWLAKKRLSDKISTPYIEELYEEARRHGAVGGKVTGAGGGGYLLFIADPSRRFHLIEKMRSMGVPVETVSFAHTGATCW